MNPPYEIAPDIHVLPSYVTIPGIGVLPINAFLFSGEEALLIDTGVHVDSDAFVESLRSLVEPGHLRYVVLSHDDGDHTGSLEQILRLAPNAQVLTHALAALRASFSLDLPLDRVHAIVPGEQIPVGKRTFRVFRPPLFDNPTTLGLYDAEAKVMFSVDCFGGIMPRWSAEAGDYSAEELTGGMLMWASLDDPWVRHYERAAYAALLEQTRALPSDLVLCSHLPPARGLFDMLIEVLEEVPDVEPFPPPDHTAFSQIVAAMKVSAGA